MGFGLMSIALFGDAFKISQNSLKNECDLQVDLFLTCI